MRQCTCRFRGFKPLRIDGVQLSTKSVVRRFNQPCLLCLFFTLVIFERQNVHSNFLRLYSFSFWVKIGKMMTGWKMIKFRQRALTLLISSQLREIRHAVTPPLPKLYIRRCTWHTFHVASSSKSSQFTPSREYRTVISSAAPHCESMVRSAPNCYWSGDARRGAGGLSHRPAACYCRLRHRPPLLLLQLTLQRRSVITDTVHLLASAAPLRRRAAPTTTLRRPATRKMTRRRRSSYIQPGSFRAP